MYLYCLQSDVCAWKAKWSCCSFNEEIPHQVYKVGKPLSFDWIELLHLIWNIHCNANWAFNQGEGRNNNWCKHSRQKPNTSSKNFLTRSILKFHLYILHRRLCNHHTVVHCILGCSATKNNVFYLERIVLKYFQICVWFLWMIFMAVEWVSGGKEKKRDRKRKRKLPSKLSKLLFCLFWKPVGGILKTFI